MSGRSPYAAETNLGTPISPMLGGILLAAPFVVIGGNVYWMGMTWLSAATLFMTLRSGAQASLAFLALMIASPLVRIELVNQSDLVVNGLALLLFGSLSLWLARRARVNAIWGSLFAASAAGFAFAVAYRIPFGLVAIPLVAYLWRLAGSTMTLLWVAILGSTVAGLTAIPWIMDPQVGLTPIAILLNLCVCQRSTLAPDDGALALASPAPCLAFCPNRKRGRSVGGCGPWHRCRHRSRGCRKSSIDWDNLLRGSGDCL